VTPVDQTRFGHGAGNCLAACIASLLDLSIDQVFDIPEGGKDPDYWGIVDRWLTERGLGLAYVTVRKEGDDERLGATVRIPPDAHYMAWGESPRNLSHSVIYRSGELIHDPHPSRDGILRVENIAFLVRLT
jgi:hypothetical protein